MSHEVATHSVAGGVCALQPGAEQEVRRRQHSRGEDDDIALRTPRLSAVAVDAVHSDDPVALENELGDDRTGAQLHPHSYERRKDSRRNIVLGSTAQANGHTSCRLTGAPCGPV